MDINIKVRVSLEAGTSLMHLVELVTDALRPTINEQGAVAHVRAYTRVKNGTETTKDERMKSIISPSAAAAARSVDDEDAEDDKADEAEAETPAADEPHYPTDDELKAAIDACRCRLLGADWKTNPTGEAASLRKPLDTFIKGQASSLAASYNIDGVKKPTDLPVGPSRVAMVKTLDEIVIIDGKPTIELPY